ncbi:MAG: hypothetical protein GY888_26465, partial [Planctomycetaceae bacterium]|nr:hypothetical protein [Planctomycetaceae bacterium]
MLLPKSRRAGDAPTSSLLLFVYVLEPAQKKRSLMNILRISLLLVLVSAWSVLAVEDGTDPVTLEKAREEGRVKSRFLKEIQVDQENAQVAPKPNLAPFQSSIGPILKKSCLACHGPQKSEGRLRIDKLNPN